MDSAIEIWVVIIVLVNSGVAIATSMVTGKYSYILYRSILKQLGARRSSVVRAFAHGAMGRRIDPSWGRNH